jgi:hypothetical protein
MNDILKYNTHLVVFILVASLVIIIAILGYKIYDKYFGLSLELTMGLKEREPFSQITLEKQVALYDDYRNYINGRNELTSKCGTNKRMIPYIVSPKCFANKYQECMGDKKIPTISSNQTNIDIKQDIIDTAEVFDELNQAQLNSITTSSSENLNSDSQVNHINQYEDGFKITSRNCQDQSYDMCLTDNFNFI